MSPARTSLAPQPLLLDSIGRELIVFHATYQSAIAGVLLWLVPARARVHISAWPRCSAMRDVADVLTALTTKDIVMPEGASTSS